MGKKFIITEQDRRHIRGLYSHLLKEIGETKTDSKCQEWIIQNFSNVIPYDYVYVRGRCRNELQEYVMGRINSLEPIKYAESFLPEAKQFYIDYFDYNKTPEIIDKIITISQKNGKPTTKESIVKVIEFMKTTFLNKISFEIDFRYNKKHPEIMMYTINTLEVPKIYICGMNEILFVGDYKLGDSTQWKNSVQHEIGHLIDFLFFENGILLHSKAPTKNGIVLFPHKESGNDEFLNWGDYQKDTDEQFVRFKFLFAILSKYGLTMSSDLNTFIGAMKKALDSNVISFEGCAYKIEKNQLIIDEGCEEFKDTEMYVSSNGQKDDDLTYLFSNYTRAHPIESASDEPNQNVFYQVNLGALYNDWKNEYVMNQQNKQTATSAPNYPTA